MRPVFRNPGDAALVDDGMVRSRHGTGGQGNRVLRHNARLGIELADVASLVTGEPNVALGVSGSIVKGEQLLRQLVFSNDDPRLLSPGAREHGQARGRYI